MSEDDRLVERACAGHRRSLELLLRRHEGPLRAFAAVLAPQLSLADDLAQETFLRAIDQLAQYRGPDCFAPWLRGIARNVAREHWREAARSGRAAQADPDRLADFVQDQAEGILDQTVEAEIGALQRCLQDLDRRARQTLELRFRAGMSSESIGEALQRQPGSIRATLSRLYTRLRRCILQRLEQEKLDRAGGSSP